MSTSCGHGYAVGKHKFDVAGVGEVWGSRETSVFCFVSLNENVLTAVLHDTEKCTCYKYAAQ